MAHGENTINPPESTVAEYRVPLPDQRSKWGAKIGGDRSAGGHSLPAGDFLAPLWRMAGVRYILACLGKRPWTSSPGQAFPCQQQYVCPTRHGARRIACIANVYGRLHKFLGSVWPPAVLGDASGHRAIAKACLDRAPLVARTGQSPWRPRWCIPRARWWQVTGAGGFLMHAQELETAQRLGTAFVTGVWTIRTTATASSPCIRSGALATPLVPPSPIRIS